MSAIDTPLTRSVSVEVLRERLSYDPITGVLRWRANFGSVSSGSEAGCLKKDGYLDVRVCGVTIRAHRAAWAIHYGVHPTMFLDHQDGNRRNNRISNLRECTPQQNSANVRPQPSATGFKGVIASKDGKFLARFGTNPRRHLGAFATAEEAARAYDEVALEVFGEFASLNFPPVSKTQESTIELSPAEQTAVVLLKLLEYQFSALAGLPKRTSSGERRRQELTCRTFLRQVANLGIDPHLVDERGVGCPRVRDALLALAATPSSQGGRP